LHLKVLGKEDHTFFEQYHLPCGPIRAGDYVYVRVEDAKKLIAKVDSMWSDGRYNESRTMLEKLFLNIRILIWLSFSYLQRNNVFPRSVVHIPIRDRNFYGPSRKIIL